MTTTDFAERVGGGGGLLGRTRLQAQESRQTQQAPPAPEDDPLRRTALLGKRPAMLQLCRHAGDAQAFGYAWLASASFDPSAGIVLDFSSAQVSIQGRNLRPLFDAIAAHRVRKVFQTEQVQSLALPEDQPVVTRIEVVSTL